MQLNESGKTLRSALPLLLAATCSTEAEEFALDYRVKASYLFNLLRFIEWPHDVHDPDGRLNLCISGADRLDGFYALHGERVGRRTISVERAGGVSDSRLRNCHIWVVSGDEPIPSVPIVRGLLTVGETEGFTARGGMINLLLVGGRVRFELNEDTAKACGFEVDPRLSKLKLRPSYLAQVA